MDDLNVVYKILTILDKSMDSYTFDEEELSPERFGIGRERRDALLLLLADEGFVTGLKTRVYSDEVRPRVIDLSAVRITLDGLKHLSENE